MLHCRALKCKPVYLSGSKANTHPEKVRGRDLRKEEMQNGTLLVKITTRGHFQSIQHALCHFPYSTDLQM